MSPNAVNLVSGPYTQRGEGGARRVSVGRMRGARPLGAERLVKVAAVWLRGGEERGNRDAPHPPIASQWAPPSPRFAGAAGMTESKAERAYSLYFFNGA